MATQRPEKLASFCESASALHVYAAGSIWGAQLMGFGQDSGLQRRIKPRIPWHELGVKIFK